MGQTTDIYLSLGSNLGDRELNLEKAIQLLEEIGTKLIQSSSIYQTAAWGNDELNVFLNMVIKIESDLSPEELLRNIKSIEEQMGRKLVELHSKEPREYQNRLIDIDILYYGKKVIDNEDLSIPHRQLHLRRFVLEPLREIAPDFLHPLLKKTSLELHAACPDKTKVELHS